MIRLSKKYSQRLIYFLFFPIVLVLAGFDVYASEIKVLSMQKQNLASNQKPAMLLPTINEHFKKASQIKVSLFDLKNARETATVMFLLSHGLKDGREKVRVATAKALQGFLQNKDLVIHQMIKQTGLVDDLIEGLDDEDFHPDAVNVRIESAKALAILVKEDLIAVSKIDAVVQRLIRFFTHKHHSEMVEVMKYAAISLKILKQRGFDVSKLEDPSLMNYLRKDLSDENKNFHGLWALYYLKKYFDHSISSMEDVVIDAFLSSLEDDFEYTLNRLASFAEVGFISDEKKLEVKVNIEIIMKKLEQLPGQDLIDSAIAYLEGLPNYPDALGELENEIMPSQKVSRELLVSISEGIIDAEEAVYFSMLEGFEFEENIDLFVNPIYSRVKLISPKEYWLYHPSSLHPKQLTDFYFLVPSQYFYSQEEKLKVLEVIKVYFLMNREFSLEDIKVIHRLIDSFENILDVDLEASFLLAERIGLIAEFRSDLVDSKMLDYLEKALLHRKKREDHVRILSVLVRVAVYLDGEQNLAKRAAKVVESFFNETFKESFIQPLSLISLILFRRPELLEDPMAISEKIKLLVKLSKISLYYGGTAPTNYGKYVEGIFANAPVFKFQKLKESFPERKEVKKDFVFEVKDIDFLIDQKEYQLSMLFGRTAIYKSPKGKYVFFKFLNDQEKNDPGILLFESEGFDYMNRNKKSLSLKAKYPLPIEFIPGEKVVKFKNLPKGLEALIEEQEIKLKEKKGRSREERLATLWGDEIVEKPEIILDNSDGYYMITVFELDSLDYFAYLSDLQLANVAYEKAFSMNVQELFHWARYGLIHTSIIDLFHTSSSMGTQGLLRYDLGHYFWMLDFIRYWKGAWDYEGKMVGTGRLHAWNKLDFPNLGISGPRDLAEVDLLFRLMKPDHSLSKHLTHYLRSRFGSRTLNVYLASYLGDYLLGLSLLAMHRLREEDQLNWKSDASLNLIENKIKNSIFNEAYQALLGFQAPDFLVNTIDWRRLSRQVAFFMSKNLDYVEPINSRKFPEVIYGEKVVFENLPPYRRGINVESGWMEDEKHADLGPYQGVNPLDELIKALHIYSTAMAIGKQRTPASYISESSLQVQSLIAA